MIVLFDFAAAQTVLPSATQDQNGVFRGGIQGTPTRGSQLSGNGATFVSQTKPAIDVRDTPGVDCTGAKDSSASLNSLFTHISNTHVIIPAGCNLSIANKLVIFGQQYFVIDGQGDTPANGNGGRIYGCGGADGPLLYVNRSSNGTIRGLSVEAKGPSGCNSKSLFTGSIEVDNTGGGGVTGTRMLFENNWITSSSSGFAVTNYVGIQIGVGGQVNLEDMHFRGNYIHCQKSLNSAGIVINGGNSDNDIVEANNIHSCFQGVQINSGHATIRENKLGNNGIYGIFGPHGADIYVGFCTRSILIEANGSSSSGPFLNSNNDSSSGGGGCSKGIILIGNDIGIGGGECGGCTAMDATTYPINLGVNGATNSMQGNIIRVFGSTTKPCVGSDSQGNDGQGYPHGPLGTLMDLGGNTCDSAGGLFQSSLTGNSYAPYQGGEWHPGSQIMDQVLSSPISNVRAGNKRSSSLIFRGHFLNGSSVSTNDDWNWRSILGAGTNPTSTFTLTHTGSTGRATVSIPIQIVSTLPTGTAPFSVVSTTVVPNLNSSYVNGFSVIQLTDTPGAITVNASTCTDRSVALAAIMTNATITVSAAYALETNLAVSPARVEARVGAHYRICNMQSSGNIVLAAGSAFTLKVIQ